MPAAGRLKKRADFLRVAAARRKWVTPGLILQGMPRACDADAPGDVRIGFTVTRKVGNAVVRNRVRRRLRALARDLLPLHETAGWDYVLIGRGETAGRAHDALKADLTQALRRLPGAAPSPPRRRRASKSDRASGKKGRNLPS